MNRLPKFLLAVTALLPLAARADNLLNNASFEQPKIEGRTEEPKGANPALTEAETTWAHFQTMEPSGRLKVGMTDEVSRSGKQSIYVEFTHAEKTKDAFLMSDLIAVKPESRYRISMWGRLDPKRPLTLLQARPLLRLEVEFYEADQATQAGDTEYRTQPMPGSPRRVLFETGKWNEYFSEVKSPEGSVFMKITFRWEPPGEEGEADGIIYFDDAVVDGPAGQVAAPAPDADPAKAATPAPAAPPAPPAPPAK